MSLVLIGFMGAGKSRGARDAANALGIDAADSDALVAAELGMSIETFFEREGEAAFREIEERVVCTLLDRNPAIVALGGGAVLSDRVRERLRDHTVAFVEVDPETAWERAAGRGRPLARDRAAFELRYAERLPLYEQLADAFVPSGEVAPAAAALGRRPEGTRMIWYGNEPVTERAPDGGWGAITSGSWPRATRCSATRTTEWATPFTSGGNDSVTIAIRMP